MFIYEYNCTFISHHNVNLGMKDMISSHLPIHLYIQNIYENPKYRYIREIFLNEIRILRYIRPQFISNDKILNNNINILYRKIIENIHRGSKKHIYHNIHTAIHRKYTSFEEGKLINKQKIQMSDNREYGETSGY